MSPEPLKEETLSLTDPKEVETLPKTYSEVFSLIAKYGIASVIAVYLVWFVTTNVTNDHTAMRAQQETITQTQKSIENTLKVHIDESTRYIQILTVQSKALARICVNTAQTPADRERCVE